MYTIVMTSREHFEGKRIAVVGLGPHGEMVADTKFLIKMGALTSVYDLRSEARLKSHLVLLRSVGLANYVCGSIPADDLMDMDLIILSPEYPRDSSFLKKAREKGVAIEYPETFFLKQAPPVTVVGILGSAGKSTVVSMLSPMLTIACASYEDQGFFVIDPEQSDGIIANLKKVKNGDVVLMRIPEPMMREYRDLNMSPHVAVFVSLPRGPAFDQSPFEILAYQTYNNYIVASDEIVDAIRLYKFQPKAKMLRTKAVLIPPDWQLNGRGLHDRDNAALALQVARLFKVSDETVRQVLEKWKPLKAHIELVKKVKNVEFYNDAASVTAHATIAALEAVSVERNVVLIFGGAGSGLDYRELYGVLPNYAHTVVTLPGSGTLRERARLREINNLVVESAPSLEEAVRIAFEHARKGDRVLFSPGFDAGGFDRSRKERGERFVKAVRGL